MTESSPANLSELPALFDRLAQGETIGLSAVAGPRPRRLPPPRSPGPWLGLLSSGTTGRPKRVWRRWAELTAEAGRSESTRGWVWAAPYQPHTFAGIQVALEAWLGGGRVLSLGTDFPAVWRALLEERVDALCCTPTFLDLLLQNEPEPSASLRGPRGTPRRGAARPDAPGARGAAPPSLNRSLQLRQITLGGEVLRPALGARLASRFPAARLTVIYATTELGVLLKTHRSDGWYELEGFPRRKCRWRVNRGVLEVWRDGCWRSTADQVEVDRGLLRIVGRADAVANVAGVKVGLAEISRLAEEVPGVRRAVAAAEPSSISGQIVCLKFAVASARDELAVTRALQEHLRARLPREAWPRRWELNPVGLARNAKRTLR